MSHGWIGVDFDGTLAKYDGWVSPTHCGEPVPLMVGRVKNWLRDGRAVKIFSARIWPIAEFSRNPYGAFQDQGIIVDASERLLQARTSGQAIIEWCEKHLQWSPIVTCVKDYSMVELYDDRCVQVVPNTGELVEGVEDAEPL